MLPCIGSQTQATSSPAAVTFSTSDGSASWILPAPIRVMKVSRPASLSGLSLAARAIRSSGVERGPTLTPSGLRTEASSSAWAPSRALVRSPIQTKWPETSYGVPVRLSMRVIACSYSRRRASWQVWKSTRWNSSGSAPIADMKLIARSISCGDLLVAPAHRRADHEVGVPGVDLAQVGVTAGDERTHEVQGRGAGVVGLDQPLRVGDAGLGGEVEAVDRVAAVRGQGHALAGLEVGGARLGVLAGQPAQLHHRHRGGVGQDDGHLEQDAQLVADVVGSRAVERLRAVAALQQEGLAVRDVGELALQLVALAGEDERRHPAEPGDGGVDGGRVGVRRLLGRAHRAQRLEVGDTARTAPAGPEEARDEPSRRVTRQGYGVHPPGPASATSSGRRPRNARPSRAVART